MIETEWQTTDIETHYAINLIVIEHALALLLQPQFLLKKQADVPAVSTKRLSNFGNL